MKKNIYLIITLFFSLFLITGCKNVIQKEEIKEQEENYLTGKHYVIMDIENYGSISLELDADEAPITVTNFIHLVNDGFYNGLTFHRIINKFMIQGGDPNHDGTGGSDNTIKGEFNQNNIDNHISHTRGTISMARNSNSFDSASSQFFIVHEDSLFLDGAYAAFGHVTEGMEIIDKICEDAKPTDDNGTIPYEQQPIIKSIKVVD